MFVCLFCLALLGFACLACRFLPLLALLVIIGVAQRCLFFAWRYLALLVALVRFSSLTRFPFSCLPGGWVTESAWTFMSKAGRYCLSGTLCGRVGEGVGRHSERLFFYHFLDYVF